MILTTIPYNKLCKKALCFFAELFSCKLFLSIFFCLTFYNISTFAQDKKINELKNWQLKGYGNDAVRVGDTYSAIQYFNEFVKRKPNNFKCKYLLAQLYLKNRDYIKAKNLFQNVYQVRPVKYLLAHYFYAQILKNTGEYDEAFKQFKIVEKENKKHKSQQINVQALKNEIVGCLFAIHRKDTITNKIIFHLDSSINKPHIEFSPVIINDSVIVYGTSDANLKSLYSIEQRNKIPFRKFVKAKMCKDSSWEKSVPELPFINYDDSHSGNGCYSLEKNRFYSTRCKENANYKINCNLYVSEKKNGSWEEPVVLDNTINAENYSSTQPTVGTCYIDNLEVVYFSSDRAGGFGGYDIWYTIYNPQNKTYTEASNAGVFLNTRGDEKTPFYDTETHSLFFSSNGLPGFGGMDIFRSFGDMVNWSQPENIGYPVNSGYDDLFYTFNPDKNYGFFTSNRNGSNSAFHENCCDDIYSFSQTKIEKIAFIGKLIFKEIIKLPIDLNHADKSEKIHAGTIASLYLVERNIGPIFIAKDSIKTDGRISFNLIKNKEYKIIIEDNRLLENSFIVRTNNDNNMSIRMDSILLRIIPEKPIVLNNILYDFDSSVLVDSVKKYIDTTLILLMEKYSDINIEIYSHTDSKGSEEYNLNLSEKRAESVVKYIAEKGIEKERLKSKGFGSKMPIAKNSNIDGTDNPEGRKLNRRTEFKIIKQ